MTGLLRVGLEHVDLETPVPQPVREPAHARPVQDEFLHVEPVLPEHQIVFDEDEAGAGVRVEVRLEQLMRQHHADDIAGRT